MHATQACLLTKPLKVSHHSVTACQHRNMYRLTASGAHLAHELHKRRQKAASAHKLLWQRLKQPVVAGRGVGDGELVTKHCVDNEVYTCLIALSSYPQSLMVEVVKAVSPLPASNCGP